MAAIAQMNEVIRNALLTQGDGHGDNRPPPTLNQATKFAKEHFKNTTNGVFSDFLASCADNGSQPLIGKLSVKLLSPKQADIATEYFGGHIENSAYKPQGHLGSKYMSFSLQNTDHPAFKPESALVLPDKVAFQSDPPSKVSPSYPAGCDKQSLNIGELDLLLVTEHALETFNDSSGLALVLLLNKLYGGESFPRSKSLLLESATFPLREKNQESDSKLLFEPVVVLAEALLKVMQPALQVRIGENPVIGGIADISVAVWGLNQHYERQCVHAGIIELKEPGIAYRAANTLTFGDKLTDDDFNALEETIDSTELHNSKLELTRDSLQILHKLGVKHTVEERGDSVVHGYTFGDVDVTDGIEKSYLKQPLEDLHAELFNTYQYGSLNGCRSTAVSDGFTLIATDLLFLDETQPDLITANYGSHYALDMTEDGSSLKLLQYLINAAFRDPRVVYCALTMLRAAAEEVGDEEITPEKVERLKELKNHLRNYKFTTKVYSPDSGLGSSARIFTKSRDPVIKDAMMRFKQEYGAIAECGEYKSTDFTVVNSFRANEFHGIPTGKRPSAGRSRCVARVKCHRGRATLTMECVLKVYEADTAPIERMECELEAYRRISQLSEDDQKRFAKLVAFGSIDLGGVDPRLFILTAYVKDMFPAQPDEVSLEKTQSKKGPTNKEMWGRLFDAELDKVHSTLKSVGVHHNDLDGRNLNWQCVDGKWFIKVFDFDQATFDNDKKPTGAQPNNNNGSVKRKYGET